MWDVTGALPGRVRQALAHVGGPVQGCPCFQAWLRMSGDSGGGAHPKRLEHSAPPEGLPLRKGLVPMKKARCL